MTIGSDVESYIRNELADGRSSIDVIEGCERRFGMSPKDAERAVEEAEEDRENDKAGQ